MEDGFILKNHKFYRRTGALWTDPYHTPASRMHLTNFRSDLDQEHHLQVQKCKEDETDRLKEENLLLLNNQAQIRTLFRQQYEANRRQTNLSSTIRVKTKGDKSRNSSTRTHRRKKKGAEPEDEMRRQIDCFEENLRAASNRTWHLGQYEI